MKYTAESQENGQETRGLIETLYSGLFTIESGEILNVIYNIAENTHIDNYGLLEEISGELALLTGEPSDFVISWNETKLEGITIIPSGEINFSQKIREIPALQNTTDWVHILLGYSIIVVLLTEIYFTILKMLGVSVSIYDQNEEEIERLKEMYEEKFYQTTIIPPKAPEYTYVTRRKRL